MTDDTTRMVREYDTCHHWECVGVEVLAPMHECWYCKYSDFRKDINVHRKVSVCHLPQNLILDEEKEF